MGRRDRVGEAAWDAASQQANALGMTQEEMEAAMQSVHHDSKTIYYIDPDRFERGLQPVEIDSAKFVTIWPNYIDANKSIPKGRRIPKASACPAPTVEDMSEVLRTLQLRHTLEPWKQYPRDFLCPGRVKVELFGASSRQPVRDDIRTRRDLMVKLGEAIPSLKSRQVRLEAEAAALKAQAAVQKGVANTTTGPNKKKGKKGKQKGK